MSKRNILAKWKGDIIFWKDFFLLGRIYFSSNYMDDALKYLSKAKILVNLNNLPNF